MNTERIINSNIDTDLYKLTMGQAVLHNYPNTVVGYEFINRGKTQFPDQFDTKLQRQIEMMADISLTPSEKNFLLSGCNGVLTPDFVDWFANYQFSPDEVTIKRENYGLAINIDGPWERTIFWEVPLMALISELYFKETKQTPDSLWEQRCKEKALRLKEAGARFADFGTRRRYSHQIHDRVVEILKENAGAAFLGTSNVELAKKHGVSPIGTFAHEMVMAMMGLYGPEQANQRVLELWAKEFNGKLATALTDTVTTDIFLRDFNYPMAEVFKTFRQDSGNPNEWTNKVISRLHQLNIDPLTRVALYSDGLDVQSALDILDYNRNKIQTLFGIGTNLTNDVGPLPLNIVIKLLYVIGFDGQRKGVCKLSDNPGKISGDPQALENAKQRLGISIVQRDNKPAYEFAEAA